MSLQLFPNLGTGRTLRSATPVNWVDSALAAGYAAAVGSSRIFSGSALPYPRPFFEALRRGWTLAEAWYVSAPLLREGLFLVGDPLLRVSLPAAGWDVYGPVARLEEMDVDSPTVATRGDERAAVLANVNQPADGEAALYLVRHVDELGRSQATAQVVRAARDGDVARRPAVMPMWPTDEAWPARVEAGEVVLPAWWGRPLGTCSAAKVELMGEVDGAAEAVMREVTLDRRATLVEVRQALPAAQARFRWRVTSVDGVVQHTPWSRVVRAGAAAATALQLVEEQL